MNTIGFTQMIFEVNDMSFAKNIVKIVFIIFILILMANPFYSASKYDQRVAWITGLIFGLIIIFFIFVHFKDKLGAINGKGLQYS